MLHLKLELNINCSPPPFLFLQRHNFGIFIDFSIFIIFKYICGLYILLKKKNEKKNKKRIEKE